MTGHDLRCSFEIFFSYIVNSISVFAFQKCSSSLNAEDVNFLLSFIFFLESAVFDATIETDFSFVLLLEQMHCVVALENIFAQEDEQERSAEIVYALDVSACWVTNGPNEEDASHHALHLLAFE